MINQALWHFHCPECGFGDGEHGHLLDEQEIYCFVCLHEEQRYVRLRRWERVEADIEQG